MPFISPPICAPNDSSSPLRELSPFGFVVASVRQTASTEATVQCVNLHKEATFSAAASGSQQANSLSDEWAQRDKGR